MLRKEIHQPPIEIFVHISETMTLPRKNQHLETLISPDQSIHNTDRIRIMDIIIDITMYKHQMTFQLLNNFGIRSYFINKSSISFFRNDLFHAMMCLAPPTVINPVVVVPGTGYRSFIKIGILTNCSCRHKATSRMTVYADSVDIYKLMAGSQLFDSHLMIGQRIITHIPITIIMIPFGAGRMSTPLSY